MIGGTSRAHLDDGGDQPLDLVAGQLDHRKGSGEKPLVSGLLARIAP
jgi:hypothetical protein